MVKFAMLAVVLVFACRPEVFPKDTTNFPDLSGDYSRVPNEWDTSFHLSIQQRGSQVELSFMGTLRGGKGRSIEGSGTGSVSATGLLTFSFQDPFGNSGSGTLKKSGRQFVLSIEPSEIKEPGLMPFYGTFRMTRDRPR